MRPTTPFSLVHKIPSMPSSTLSLPFHKIIVEEQKSLEADEPQDEGAWAPELLHMEQGLHLSPLPAHSRL